MTCDLDPTRAADARSTLQSNPDGWLATGAPDGQPHLIAVSTCWTGSDVVIATLAGSRTARNLATTRTARLALGAPDDVVMLDLAARGESRTSTLRAAA